MARVRKRSARARRSYVTDEERWQAVLNRDPAAEGVFFYAVETTGVYCRNVCSAKLASRKNVRFFKTAEEAEAAGFRPCKRCRPTEASRGQKRSAVVRRACRMIEQCGQRLRLDDLAHAAGMSSYHFHRLFKSQTGVTPRAYATASEIGRVRSKLKKNGSITSAIYAAGFNSNGRFYEKSANMLGMTPTAFRSGGSGTIIQFAVSKCWLGFILVAASKRGICAILLGDNERSLDRELQQRFPNANLKRGSRQFVKFVSKVVRFVETPHRGLDLPVDIRGTAFQQRVWEALRRIPPGSTATYRDVAERIGKPTSSRAVANAVAANPLAVAIPCHRVVRSDGSLAGYRWGVARKDALLKREKNAQ